jgi:crossover junction endodeoxyribonuclease RuvC|tara:strand:- start:54 stop:431 length:378 start_codon:yes stop_codon:yes gene_type:complete
LATIYSGVSEVIQDWRPQSAAVERVFLASNPHAALILGHARGSAMLAAVNQGLPISDYSALEIKRSVVGTGSAAKEQVQHMVRVLLSMDHKPPIDAADALACAICHLHTAEGERRLQPNQRRAGG